MMIRIVALFFCFISLPCFATNLVCPNALPTTNPAFCGSFTQAATCYCSKSLPEMMCKDMTKIYQRMLAVFGSVENACRFQKETTPQTCIDDWTCYLKGGKDSQGGLCSGSGKSCV